MKANGLLPEELVGLETTGDLEERVVQTVRSSVAPVPSFSARAVETESGRAGLVVHVPEGTQPPYILIRTGQVLVRTPTSSEPAGINDREALDRLFARGERGRAWAKKVTNQLRDSVRDSWTAQVWTVPAVDEGIAAMPAIFTSSFIQAVIDVMKSFYVVSAVFLEQKARRGMGEDRISVSTPTYEDSDSFLSMQVLGAGIIHTQWMRPSGESDSEWLKVLLRWALPSHGRLYELGLGHRGDVAVAASAHWISNDRPGLAFVERTPVRSEELSEAAFYESLDRSIHRSQGHYMIEPEP
jgi:hypothetical protein